MGGLAAVACPDEHVSSNVHSLQARQLLEPEQERVSTLAGAGEDDASRTTGAPELLLQDLFQHLQFGVLWTTLCQASQFTLVVCQKHPKHSTQA